VGWGILNKDLKRSIDHLVAIKILKEGGMKGSGIVGVYHARRVVPLMAHALLMPQMVPFAPLEGTVLTEKPLANSEIMQCLMEAIDSPKDSTRATIEFVYLVPRHPPMWPEPGFVRFVSYPLPSPFFPSCLVRFCSSDFEWDGAS
jgi:hypothetical protein